MKAEGLASSMSEIVRLMTTKVGSATREGIPTSVSTSQEPQPEGSEVRQPERLTQQGRQAPLRHAVG